MKIINKEIPKNFEKDVFKAIEILKEAGCSEIYVFGSIANNTYNENSDIDFAVKGLPNEIFFKVMGKLMKYLEHEFDLIDLDEKDNRFCQFIINNGEFIYVA